MNRTDNPAPTLSLDNQADETRMRRALGLHGGAATTPHQQRPEQARQRHKFASDGSVPVVMLNRSSDMEAGGAKERITALEATLEAERNAHAATRRTLHDAQAAHQALQTRLAHTELAHREALAAERQLRKQAEEAQAAPVAPPQPKRAEPAAERAAPQRVTQDRVTQDRVTQDRVTADRVTQDRVTAERAVRKPRANAAPPKEPKPVRWWTPSYRASKT